MSAVFRFPGIDGVFSGSVTLGHGIQPAVATVEVPLSANLTQPVGTLSLTAPGGFALSFPNCRVDKITKTADETFMVTIFDRRWKWRFGEISGVYNQRLPDGTLDPDLEKAPQDIAKDCLDAMGEAGYQVGELPNNTRPEYRWVAQNPASMLDQLCQSLGCAVVLGLDNRVSLRKLGEGAELPDNPLKDGSDIHDFPIVPDSVSVVSGPRSIEALFELRAVGFEKDGQRKPIDELSYIPGTWDHTSPTGAYYDVVDKDDRELAKKHLYRTYEILKEASERDEQILLDGRRLEIGHHQATKLKHLRFYDQTNRTEVSDSDHESKPERSEVTGTYANGAHSHRNYTGRVRATFRLDVEKALVTFDEPLFMVESSTSSESTVYKPARLFLRCRCELLQDTTGHRLRYVWNLPTGERNGTEPQFEHRFDIIPKTTVNYSQTTSGSPIPVVEGIENNDQEIERDLNSHAQAVVDGFRIVPAASRTWVGWHRNFSLDGAIRQVSYRFGEQGWFTTVNRNAEAVNVELNTLAERRQFDEIRQQAKSQSVLKEAVSSLGLA